ncbi:MAG: ABC transporter permease [bacterium]|nr:ABC transporter permease [bacterium]
MNRYLSSVITILVAIIISFFLIRMMPGGFIHLRATEIQLQQSISYKVALQMAKAQYNYDPDVPLYKQFGNYIVNLCRGNLGHSLLFRIPVTRVIVKALPWTLFLCSISLFLSFSVGCSFGLVTAYRRREGWLEPISSLFSVVSQSIPDFILALILILIFAVNLRWFPFRGAYDMDTVPGFNLAFIAGVMYHAILPVSAYLLSTLGAWTLTMKASAMTVLSEDYINVARAKGLKERRILFKYVGRNAVMPLVPGLAVSFATMLSSSLFIENLFSYPGIGYFFGYSIGNRDFTLLQGILLISIVVVVLSNHIADWIHALIDPRVERH